MAKAESIIVGLLAGAAVAVCAFVAAWWFAFWLLPDRLVPAAALTGLIIGLLLDAMFLRRWVKHAYRWNLPLLMGFYLFFAVMLFAFCMGVPVFHPLLGIVAGAYVGRRLWHSRAKAARVRRSTRYVGLFTTAVMLAICLLSAIIALLNPSTATDLQRIFRLQSPVACEMILALILAGGSALVLLQYWLTLKATTMMFRLGGKNRPLTPGVFTGG